MNILIAEDNRVIQEITESLMDMWGFEYDLAMNGKEAVDLAKSNEGKYDLCLMDIDMPIMNGLEATRIIRQRLKYLPIMAMTGNSGYKMKCLRAGMDDFITKPYNLDRLHDKIRELTVKVLRIRKDHNKIILEKEMPMDQQHAQELRELAKKNLRKVKLFDSPGSTVIVHKNVTNKISHDFNIKKQVVTTFLNRDPDKPTRCELYKNTNYLMPQIFLMEEEYEDIEKDEDQDLEKYPILQLKDDEE